MSRKSLWITPRNTPRVGYIVRISIENMERINRRIGNCPYSNELKPLDTMRKPDTMD